MFNEAARYRAAFFVTYPLHYTHSLVVCLYTTNKEDICTS